MVHIGLKWYLLYLESYSAKSFVKSQNYAKFIYKTMTKIPFRIANEI